MRGVGVRRRCGEAWLAIVRRGATWCGIPPRGVIWRGGAQVCGGLPWHGTVWRGLVCVAWEMA